MKKILFFLCFLVINTKSWAEEVSILFYVADSLETNTLTRPIIESELRSWLQTTNGYFRSSQVDISMTSAGIIYFNEAENSNTDNLLDRMKNSKRGFENMFAEASRRGADYVYAVTTGKTLVDNHGKSLCGQAITVANAGNVSSIATGIAVGLYNCGASTFAHEIGHTMGLAHGDQVSSCLQQDQGSGITWGIGASFWGAAKGWGAYDCDKLTNNNNEMLEFGDIMVGNYIIERTLSSNWFTGMFSNPRVTSPLCGGGGYGSGGICGNVTNGDSAKALNYYKARYSMHNTPDAGFLSYRDAALKGCIVEKYDLLKRDSVTAVSCSNKGIGLLDGIEQLTAVTNYDFKNNNISNLSPLINIAKSRLFDVNLLGNNSALCNQVQELKNLLGARFTPPSKCFNLGVMVAINSLLLN